MDTLLLILSIVCLLVGLAGAVLPLPGPPLSFAGLILLDMSKYADFNNYILIILGVITGLMIVVDYYIPVWGTRKFGGTKYGAIGATLGLIVGFFVIPAVGIFLGTFLGALIGELIGGFGAKDALKSAFGSFIGFVTGIVMKLFLCIGMIVYASLVVWEYFS